MSRHAGHFHPGSSGNPGGRPKEFRDFVKRARILSVEGLEAVYKLAKNSADEAIRLQAWRLIIERGFGKPAVMVDGQVAVQHAHYVVRAPAMVESAAEWQARFSPQLELRADPVVPVPVDPEPELAVTGNQVPEPVPVLDPTDPAWRPPGWGEATAAEVEPENCGVEAFTAREGQRRFAHRVRALKAGEL